MERVSHSLLWEEPGRPLPPAATPGGPERLEWEIRDCFFVYSNALADAAAIQADLPEGFTVQTMAPGRASVGFEANRCASGTGLNGTVEGQTYASVWVGVTPPEGLVAQPGVFHVVNFEVLVEDAPRRTWMQERGIPAHDGAVGVTTTAGHVITIAMGSTEHTLTVGQTAPLPAAGGTFDQWTPGDQGLTYWKTDWATQDVFQGDGTIDIDPGSIYADWFESPTVPARFNVGTWDYTDGEIVHPAPTA